VSFLGNNFPAANSYEQLSYGYDALGRRVVKDVAGEAAEIMVYDDEDVVKAEAGGVVEKRFVHGPGIDDYVAMVRPDGLPEAGTYNYHADGLGSVTAMSDNSDATLQASYEYRPFGDANELSGTGIEQFNPYEYTGRELDDETGLMFYRSRYFSPEQRRFVEEDRWNGIKTVPMTYINAYAYVGNNPVNAVDPYGYVGWGDVGWATAGIIGNSLGVVVGFALILAPEPTLLTKVVGYTLIVKSVYGLGASWYNLTTAITQESDKYDAPETLPRAVAAGIAPKNKKEEAYMVADVVDLSIDLCAGRGKIMTNQYDKAIRKPISPVNDMFWRPSLIYSFQASQVLYVGTPYYVYP